MTAALLLLLLSQAADLAALIKQQRYQEAVAQARSPVPSPRPLSPREALGPRALWGAVLVAAGAVLVVW